MKRGLTVELADREMYVYDGLEVWDGDQQLCSECLKEVPSPWRTGWKRVYVPAWIDGERGYEQCDRCLTQIEYADEQLRLRLYDLLAMKQGYPHAATHPPGGLECVCRQIPGHRDAAQSWVPWRWDHAGCPVHESAA